MNAASAENEPFDDAASAPRPRRSLTQRVVSGGAWSLAGRVGSMGSVFLLQVVLFHSLDKASLAAYLTTASLVPLLAMLATMGVPMTLVRVIRGSTSGAVRREAFVGAATLTAAAGLTAAIAFAVLSSYLPDAPKWQVLRGAPWIVGAWFVMSALCMVAANFLQAEDDFRTAALVGARSGGLIPNAAALAATALVAALGQLNLQTVLAIQLLAYAAALAIGTLVIAQTLRPSADELADEAAPTLPPGPYNARWYFFESWPNLLNQLVAVVLTEVDLLWIAIFSDEQTVASYGVIRNLRLLVAAPLMVVSVALPPFVAELYSRRETARLERLIRGAATAVSLPSLAVLAVLLLAPETIIRLVGGPEFVSAAAALQVVVIGSAVFVLSGSNGMTLTMTGQHRDLLACGATGLVFYAVISPPLVMHYGVLGAAIAYTLQTIGVNVATTLRVKQLVGIWTLPYCSWRAMRFEAAQLHRHLRARR